MAIIPKRRGLATGRNLENAVPDEAGSGLPDTERSSSAMLETHRDYLLAVATKELGTDLKAKLEASDLVQETFLAARRDAGTFRGQSPEEWRSWLRAILQNLASNTRRHYRKTACRRVDREVPLDPIDVSLADTASSPSSHAARRERAEVLALAVARLPEHYRQVLHWHHQEGQTFEQIATRMGISAEAARKLWGRALVRLREALRPIE